MIRRENRMVHLRRVEELPRSGDVSRWTHPEWEDKLPWLAQGITDTGGEGERSDFALFTPRPREGARSRWRHLAEGLGFPGIIHSRQIHGRLVLAHADHCTEGLAICPDADGHATGTPGVLLGITVADCVPVFLVDPVGRAVALLHAGWRGVVEGILEGGVALLEKRFGSRAPDLLVHLGPAICGECYEVGTEVHGALGLPVPKGPERVDLRSILGARAVSVGVDPAHITSSVFCTLCGNSPFFSHRGGDPERQVGYLGLRPETMGGAK